jgi:hypothetical protein
MCCGCCCLRKDIVVSLMTTPHSTVPRTYSVASAPRIGIGLAKWKAIVGSCPEECTLSQVLAAPTLIEARRRADQFIAHMRSMAESLGIKEVRARYDRLCAVSVFCA